MQYRRFLKQLKQYRPNHLCFCFTQEFAVALRIQPTQLQSECLCNHPIPLLPGILLFSAAFPPGKILSHKINSVTAKLLRTDCGIDFCDNLLFCNKFSILHSAEGHAGLMAHLSLVCFGRRLLQLTVTLARVHIFFLTTQLCRREKKNGATNIFSFSNTKIIDILLH